MKVNCDNCGKRIYRNPAKFNRHKHHFCSVKCYHQYRKKTHYGMIEKGSKRDISYQEKIKKIARRNKKSGDKRIIKVSA